jgi:hypothetical protein
MQDIECVAEIRASDNGLSMCYSNWSLYHMMHNSPFNFGIVPSSTKLWGLIQ